MAIDYVLTSLSLSLISQLLVADEVVLTFGCSSVKDREEWMTAFNVFRKMALPVSEHPALQASITNGRGLPLIAATTATYCKISIYTYRAMGQKNVNISEAFHFQGRVMHE